MTPARLAMLAGMLAVFPSWPQGVEYPAMKYRSNYLSSYYLSHGSNPSPWWPAWSPDGKWIAVSMYGSIWRVDPRTGAAEELTYNRKIHSQPAWSPDGQWIVYTADDNWRSIQLEILNVASGETRALTNDGEVYVDPVFSPDGTRLAYVTSLPGGFLNVNVRPIRRGEWAGPAMAVTTDHRYGRPRLYFADNDFHTQPVWRKDGQGLLLVSNRGVALGSGKLWSVPLVENAMEQAKPILDEQSLYRTRPDVSPDGSRVVYSSTGGAIDQFNHLYLLPMEGGQPYKLTFGDYDEFHPRWSPDGEWIAYISNAGGLPQLWLGETHGGEKRQIAITERRWKRPMGKVRVTIVDAGTGQPTAARVSGEASDGKLYAPADSYVFNARLATGLRRIFFSNGEFTVEAPAGRLTMEAYKGFEYWPARAEVDVRPGQTGAVTITLKRHSDPRAKGWYNASTHVHMNYGGNLQNSPEDLLRIAAAQGMQIVSSLVACKDNRVLDWQYFSPGGRAHAASKLTGEEDSRQLLVFGEENRPPFWGHTFYIGLKDHLISPFVTGYEGTGLNSLWPTNTELFRKARAQGAATGYVHAFGGDGDPLGGKGIGGAKGFGVDVALGTIDALEWSAASRGALIPLMHAWNNDFRVAPVGGEDSLANMQDNRPIGIIRTYAYLGGALTHDGWVNAIKKGHTIASSGPVVEFSVNGERPGDAVTLAGPAAVTIEGRIWSSTALRLVRIYHNGKPWKDLTAPAGATEFKFSERAAVAASGWFSLVVEADELPPASPKDYAQAITNRVTVYVGGGKIRSRGSAEYFLNWIERLRSDAGDNRYWRTQAERARAWAQFDEAAAVLKIRAAEARE